MTTPKQRREIRRRAARAHRFDDAHIENILRHAEQIYGTLLKKIDVDQVRVTDANEAYKIATALSGLVKARIELDKWRSERTGLIEIAQEEFRLACQREFANRPKLLDQIYDVLDEAAAPKRLPE